MKLGYYWRLLRGSIFCDLPCTAPGCGRTQIPGPSIWCRFHTDAILADDPHFPECAPRIEEAGLDLEQLRLEVSAGLARLLGKDKAAYQRALARW